jgi:D-3-phosphoglycerate dehydrogenase
MPRVLVTPPMWNRRPGQYREILEQAGFEVLYPPADADLAQPAVLRQVLAGMDAVLASTEGLTRAILAESQLRVVARAGVGYDSVDVAAATELGIVVTITPGAVDVSAAEHTLALLLCLTRGMIERDRQVRTGVWARRALPQLAGKTLGIVGLGRIGKALAVRALGLQMNVIACDPQPDQEFARQHGIGWRSFDDLLREADVVSLHIPSLPETADLIDAQSLAKMKRGAILINMSRGATVDEAALCDAVRSGHLFGAGLDVFKQEPLPLDSPLLQLDNVVLCTHTGGLDEYSEVAMASIAAQAIADLYQGRWPDKCVVNRTLRAGWKW